MQLPGPGVWGPAKDHDRRWRVLRRTIELGITFFDTADSYGPRLAEQLLKDALHPYADDVVIATKAGLTRQGPGIWTRLGPAGVPPPAVRADAAQARGRADRPATSCTASTRTTRWRTRSASSRPLQDEGKIRHIGLSEVSVDQIKAAREVAEITTVQNLFNLGNRSSEDAARPLRGRGHRLHPVVPARHRRASKDDGALAEAAKRTTPRRPRSRWPGCCAARR